jgi:putative transposase
MPRTARASVGNMCHHVINRGNGRAEIFHKSAWMQWLMTTHVRRYHRHYHSCSHVWQGRFKAFAIQDNCHYLTVLRYVESNALRANLVERAEQWKWYSLYALKQLDLFPYLVPGPVQRPRNWRALVNKELNQKEIEQIQISVNRERPLGDQDWIEIIAKKLGLEHTIRPRGRPRKNAEK